MDEFLIVMAGGVRFYTGGFDTPQGVMRAIRNEWKNRQEQDDISAGITVALAAPIDNKEDVAYVTLIDPNRVVAIVDLREENR